MIRAIYYIAVIRIKRKVCFEKNKMIKFKISYNCEHISFYTFKMPNKKKMRLKICLIDIYTMYDYIIHRNNYTFLPEIILFSMHLFNFCFECLNITNLKLRLNHAVKIFLKHCQNMCFYIVSCLSISQCSPAVLFISICMKLEVKKEL